MAEAASTRVLSVGAAGVPQGDVWRWCPCLMEALSCGTPKIVPVSHSRSTAGVG
jgi:hypothetical protein